MTQRKLTITGFLFMTLFVNQLYAQQSTVTSGGDTTGSGWSVSYSIGQVAYATNSGSTGTVAQGVQQVYTIAALNNPELTALTISLQTYPNPTTANVVLVLTNVELTDLSYVLYDLNGRTIAKALVNQSQTPIEMQSLAAGVYLLKVHQNNAELKTFKIIKN